MNSARSSDPVGGLHRRANPLALAACTAATALLLAGSLQAEPALPAGLGSAPPEEPSLPAGLGGGKTTPATADAASAPREFPLPLHGFLDARIGPRIYSDPVQDEPRSLSEIRLQTGADHSWQNLTLKVVADLLFDDVADNHSLDLETGEGWLDLRQANLSATPLPFADIKIGRQILTWGTGDLIFINDNFPKDWQSFLTGRDVEYLKAPSDALKVAAFSPLANLDLVYTARFDADRFIDGSRLSYYNAQLGRRAGDDARVVSDRPDDWFDDDELAARLYRNLHGYELALYLYRGCWKSPAGADEQGRATFPALSVYGASARGPVMAGIGNVEVGYLHSRDDEHGDHPAVRNSEWRALIGYERDLAMVARDFMIGLQVYLEHMGDYGAYRGTLPGQMPARDENRHLATVRLTKLLMQQNLELSLFAFYSPSDDDAYLRPVGTYKISDTLQATLGANIFAGAREYTFFGQFENNSNVYAGIRYSY